MRARSSLFEEERVRIVIVQAKQDSALSDDLGVITAEINAYKRVAGEAVFEIGRRIKKVHNERLAERHGGWTAWLREIEMSTSQADRFMRVYEELADGKFPTSGSIALGKLYEIATLPPEDRERPHTIPSTGAIKSVDEMTVRELREVKRALKAERESRELAERQRDEALESAQALRDTIESISASSICTGRGDMERQIESATSISELYVEIEHLLKTKLAPIKYSRAILERKDSEVVCENLRGIINTVQEWCDDISVYLPRPDRKIIEAEVIYYE
ncbi:DUF3102 domain-containing protein [Brevibacillus laterosporus]|uniref:DUF3102 domain-containing protein n=1 Tax=Brevibacillus laterosporus TaxID=1465 RepID=UPI000EB027D5|nr:DUF3102 domain-containing protein [Brevibacillus laterosporus]AYK07715.1 DUF3102 domain-containing protein [Brevibacillus laterosporus]